jgi:DNA polymerase-3 subunit epsilon
MRFFRKNKVQAPDFWLTYEAYFEEKISLQTKFPALSFFVVDTETSGLDIRKDQILSIAGLSLQKEEIKLADSFDCFITHPIIRNRQSIPIHGILPKKSEQQQEMNTVIRQLLRLLQDKILVGHHISFDIAMINQVLLAMTGGKIKNTFIDTAILAQRLGTFPDRPFNSGISLDELCQFYNLKKHDRHTAAGDALLTALIFCRQLKEFESKGQNRLQNLLRAPIKTYRY